MATLTNACDCFETLPRHNDSFHSVLPGIPPSITLSPTFVIVLSGGNTMFSGMGDRIQQEMTKLAPSSIQPQVTALSDRNHLAWKGGSMLAQSSSFQEMCISKDEYQEFGSSIVHRKCQRLSV